MKTEIPEPIRNHLLLCTIALLLFGGLGIILSLVCCDRFLLLLTLSIIFAGVVKLKSLHAMAAGGTYEEIDGTVIADVPLHRKHRLILRSDHGEEMDFVLSGRPVFAVGSEWTIFVSKAEPEITKISLPQFIRPARIILGKRPKGPDSV